MQASRTEYRNYRSITDNEINSLKGECGKLRRELEMEMGYKGEGEKYRLECERLRGEIEKLRGENIAFRKGI